MTDPVTIGIASALAGKAAEAFLSGGSSALAGLYRFVRDRFASDRKASRALQRAQDDPQDARVQLLAEELQRLAADDPAFAEQLDELWEQASTELHAETGGVVNNVSGTVSGNVVQARDVHGDIHL